MKNRMTLSGVFLLVLGLATGLIGLSIGGGRVFAAQHEVDIDNLAFAPASITVAVGDSVRWANSDSVVHTVTSDSVWGSGSIPTGSSYTYTFSIAGSYSYYCEFHPSMTGTVTVVGPTNTPTQVNTPTLTNTPTKTNTPTVDATISTLTPSPTSTATSTRTPTATVTTSHTETPTVKIQDTATPTNTPTVTNTPSPTIAGATSAATATATPTRMVPLPPNTGSGASGPGSLPFFATALVLVASGLGLATFSLRRR